MQVILDHEEWEVANEVLLADVLAQVSDRAQAQSRIVTSLIVGGRSLSDRDLEPTLLATKAGEAGGVHATSQAMSEVLQAAQHSLRKYAGLLRDEGAALVRPLRIGTGDRGSLDAWLGKLADYLEMTETARAHALPDIPADSLIPWIQEVVDARAAADSVRLADLLEYELLPRLAGSGC